MPSPRPSAALSIAITAIGSIMMPVAAEVLSAGINYARGLVDAGWMDNLGRWTGKAASHGVDNDVDFLDHSEAQEARCESTIARRAPWDWTGMWAE